jgi:hypothetical protein
MKTLFQNNSPEIPSLARVCTVIVKREQESGAGFLQFIRLALFGIFHLNQPILISIYKLGKNNWYRLGLPCGLPPAVTPSQILEV